MKKAARFFFITMMSAVLFATGCSQASETQTAETNESTVSQAESDTAGEANTEATQVAEGTPAEASGDVFRIGVIQLMEHPALDMAREGFTDKLDELGVAYELDFQNAQNDQSNLKTISQRFVANDVDLVLAIATPAAQAIANETQDIPVLGTAITDYEDAGLVASNGAPGGNVSGTSDMNPIKEQIDLVAQLAPEAKTVGVVYNSSEANSKLQAQMAKEAIEAAGYACEEATITSVNDIQQVAQSLVGKVDILYLPTDNTVASAVPTLVGVTEPAGIPIIGGEANQVAGGCTATVGLNYYTLGQQTGEMAYRLLVGGEDIAAMPVETLTNFDFVYNRENCEAIGIVIPEDLAATAATVYPEE